RREDDREQVSSSEPTNAKGPSCGAALFLSSAKVVLWSSEDRSSVPSAASLRVQGATAARSHDRASPTAERSRESVERRGQRRRAGAKPRPFQFVGLTV